MPEASHLLFLDDSGTKEYSESRDYSRGVTPYFVYGGLLLSQRSAQVAFRDLRLLKERFFGRQDVEVKSNWLRRPEEREQRYIKKFGISDSDLTLFAESVYELIIESECRLYACAVNKLEVQEAYRNPYQPSAIAYECVLQRVQMDAIQMQATIDVHIDQMTGATKARRQYADNLSRHHSLLRKHGGSLQKMSFDRIGALRFTDSAHDERIQLADLVAYTAYRQFVNHGEAWVSECASIPLYEWLGRIVHKFSCDSAGVVSGNGLVRFPMRKRVKWGPPK